MDPRHDPHGDEYRRLHDRWIWLLALGTLVVMLGLAAIGSSIAATLSTVLLFGVLLVVGGVVQLVNVLLARSWGGIFIQALGGVLHILVGMFMIEHPGRAAAVLTLILALAFLVGGAARLLYAALYSFRGRGWVVVNGVVTLLLGVSIWQGWPEASLWVIGLFVGIELFFSGWSLVVLGLTARAAGVSERRARDVPLAAGRS
jgi:uncharacterized membrane protein HdeD (DUF308 family)